ncbi:MAG: hypothetical protein HY680_10430 [Chloroflexi bacterium]|nr:hypothetical protein [Chloroflexota bacterium]
MQTEHQESPRNSSGNGSPESLLERFWAAQAAYHEEIAGKSMDDKLTLLEHLMEDYKVLKESKATWHEPPPQ